MSLDRRLVDLTRALRTHGVAAGTSEVVDAAAVVTALGLDDRERLREGLAAALLRRAGQREVFDDLFDLWFPAALGRRTALADTDDPPATDLVERRERAAILRDELVRALAAADEAALEALAARVVSELGRLPNEATTGSFSAMQALESLQPATAIAAAQGLRTGGAGYAERFTRDELREAVSAFTRRVEVETRRRNAEARGTERISRYAVRPSSEHTPFLLAGAAEVAELRRTIDPLAKKLATRIAARARRHTRGTIDVRATLRRSLSTGGVPIRPAFARRRPHRTDLVVLADMSSSVAGFSRFTILLVQALAAQFRRVRIFGFVNCVEELTETIRDAAPGTDLTAVLSDTTRMTRWHRSSDYGAALADFTEHHLDAVGPRTVVLVLGDARTNHTDPRLDELRLLVDRARHVAWLNPEPARQWASGDSVAHLYGQVVDMHECRDVAQLRQFVSRVLPV